MRALHEVRSHGRVPSVPKSGCHVQVWSSFQLLYSVSKDHLKKVCCSLDKHNLGFASIVLDFRV